LPVSGAGLADVGQAQRVAGLGQRVFVHRPVDEVVRQVDNAARRSPGDRQLLVQHPILGDKISQVAGISGGEGLVNCLVGIADAHPVSLLASQQGEDLLLQAAGVLRFVFENVRPLLAQAFQQARVEAQRCQRQANQVVEIDCAAVTQRALVFLVNGGAHLQQGEWRGQAFYQAFQPCWG